MPPPQIPVNVQIDVNPNQGATIDVDTSRLPPNDQVHIQLVPKTQPWQRPNMGGNRRNDAPKIGQKPRVNPNPVPNPNVGGGNPIVNPNTPPLPGDQN